MNIIFDKSTTIKVVDSIFLNSIILGQETINLHYTTNIHTNFDILLDSKYNKHLKATIINKE